MFNQLFPVRTVQRRAVSPRVPTTVRDGVFRLNYDLLRKTPTSAVAEEAPGNHVERRFSVRKVFVQDQHADSSPFLLHLWEDALGIPRPINDHSLQEVSR